MGPIDHGLNFCDVQISPGLKLEAGQHHWGDTKGITPVRGTAQMTVVWHLLLCAQNNADGNWDGTNRSNNFKYLKKEYWLQGIIANEIDIDNRIVEDLKMYPTISWYR